MKHKPYHSFSFWLGVIWMIGTSFREPEHQIYGMILTSFLFLWSGIETILYYQKDIYEKLEELNKDETRI